jgi:hypothetical protein
MARVVVANGGEMLTVISHTATIPNDRSVVNGSWDMTMFLQAKSA